MVVAYFREYNKTSNNTYVCPVQVGGSHIQGQALYKSFSSSSMVC